MHLICPALFSLHPYTVTINIVDVRKDKNFLMNIIVYTYVHIIASP